MFIIYTDEGIYNNTKSIKQIYVIYINHFLIKVHVCLKTGFWWCVYIPKHVNYTIPSNINLYISYIET